VQYDAPVRVASLLPLLTACWSSSSPPPPPEPIHNVQPRGPAEREPLPVHTVWRGFYDCAQGKTAVQLTLDLDTDGSAKAIFDFGPHADNPDLPAGSYRLIGTSREDGPKLAIELVPDRWISQPPGYEMVGLTAATGSRRLRLRGQISNPACSTFDVQRMR
jgi:hypothetical protein